ncbi:TnpV protein [[Eubacterium] hominis]|uniref:TnpV protein n=1 Tax=[Eubacterium] hominis TaxID=2764325 RepID=UPI003A4DCEB1
MQEITYSQIDDYQMPNIKEAKPVLNSRYARLRLEYLKANQPGHLFSLRANNELQNHLKEISDQAYQRMEVLMSQLLEETPAPDKEQDMIAWVGFMNNLKASAEEIVLKEIVYS